MPSVPSAASLFCVLLLGGFYKCCFRAFSKMALIPSISFLSCSFLRFSFSFCFWAYFSRRLGAFFFLFSSFFRSFFSMISNSFSLSAASRFNFLWKGLASSSLYFSTFLYLLDLSTCCFTFEASAS